MEGSSVPSYLRRPDSYDRLGAATVSNQQRFLADRLLASAPGKRPAVSVILNS